MSDAYQQMTQTLHGSDFLDFDKLAANAQERNEQAQNKLRQEAAIVQAALDGPQGRAFVDWLAKKTLLRPASPEEQAATTAESYAIAKARREGQNQVLFMIMQALHTPQN